MKKYRILDTEQDCITLWSSERVLEEINRDHSPEWTDYDETDLAEGWKHWVEPEGRYQMLGEYIPLPSDSPLLRKRRAR